MVKPGCREVKPGKESEAANARRISVATSPAATLPSPPLLAGEGRVGARIYAVRSMTSAGVRK